MASIARTAATGGELDPGFLAWSSSLPVDRRLLAEDCAGSIAHVEGLRAAGLLTEEEAVALQEALRRLPGRVEDGTLELAAEEDVHMAIEAELGRELGAVVDKLHTGRSRNDQVATDLKLWCRAAVSRLDAAIARVLAAAESWGTRDGAIAMPSYTHRQVAIGVQAWLWIEGAVLEPLRRDRRLLLAASDELGASPLGAGAIAGTTLPIDPELTASVLGFAHGPRNPIDAVGDRDFALSLVFTCTRIALHLARLSTDAIELASDGLLRLGGAIAGGSSMMPHKRNPDVFELVRGHAALRQGELVALVNLFHGLGSGYHRDLQHDKQLVFASVDGTLGALAMIELALGHIALDRERCLAALRDGDAIATDLCESLVADGAAFRVAYRSIGALVTRMREQGRRLVDARAEDLAAVGLPARLLAELDVEAAAVRRSQRRASARPAGASPR